MLFSSLPGNPNFKTISPSSTLLLGQLVLPSSLQKAKVVCRRTPTETESAEHYYIGGIISLFAISRDHTNAHAHAEVVRL